MIQEYKSNGSLQGSYRRPREASYTDMWQRTNLGNPVTMEVMKTPCSASIPRTKGISKPTGATGRNTASQNSTHGERQPQRQTGIQESLVQLLHQPPSARSETTQTLHSSSHFGSIYTPFFCTGSSSLFLQLFVNGVLHSLATRYYHSTYN